MVMPLGTACYSLGNPPVSAGGLIFSNDALDTALAGPVAEIAFDDEGIAQLEDLLASVRETDFENSEVRRILSSEREPENWRVGEALAEAYLTSHRACSFPWPSGRDQKKESSSLPGTDLVGFQTTPNNGERFAFGEVKTSSEATFPPQIMYGRHGLRQQLEDLRDDINLRGSLVKYLGHRATGADWEPQFKSATSRYLKNTADVSLFGILVRDIDPHERDLQARTAKLAENCPDKMGIELLAMYLPQSSIATLGVRLMLKRKGGST